MSAEFGQGYGSIIGGTGGGMDDRQFAGGYQSDDYVIFQSLSDTVSSNLFQINSNVQALEKICKQLGSTLTEVPYDKLHDIQQGTNKLASDTTVCLKRMINLQGGSVAERRKQKLQQERLKDEFEDSISKYTNIQKKLKEKSKQLFNNSTSTVKFTSHRNNEKAKGDKTTLLSDDVVGDQQQLDDSVSLIEEREKLVKQLESDILDVNEIFRDLASIVHEQGEVVDSIEGNVITAHDDVINANDELRKASVYRRKARKKKCCLLLLILIILTIVILVIYFETK